MNPLVDATGRKQDDKTTWLRTCATFYKERRMSQRVELRATKNYYQALKPNQETHLPCWVSELLWTTDSFLLYFYSLNWNMCNNPVSVSPFYAGRGGSGELILVSQFHKGKEILPQQLYLIDYTQEFHQHLDLI